HNEVGPAQYETAPIFESANVAADHNQLVMPKVDSTLVVLGADRDKVLEAIRELPVEWCYNTVHDEGMLSSVICGFRALPEDTRAVLVFPGDQPGISPGVIDRLIDAFHGSSRGIVIPLYRNRRGHPLLVDMKYRGEIEKLDPERGLRSLMELFPGDILEKEVDDPGILLDIDTREDYLHAIQSK
ncbi:MAG: NTP transferase domain-containing protein, partial [Bacteroidales bacterium]